MNIASSGAFTSPTVEARILLTAENQMAAGIASARRDLQKFADEASRIQVQLEAQAASQLQTMQQMAAQATALQTQLQTQARATQQQAQQTSQQSQQTQKQSQQQQAAAQAAVNAHAAAFMQQQQQARLAQSQHATMANQAKQMRQQWSSFNAAQIAAGTQQVQQQRQIQRSVRTTGVALGSMFKSMVASATAAAVAIGKSVESYVDTAQERAAGIVTREEVLSGGKFTEKQVAEIAERVAEETGAPSTEAMKMLATHLAKTVQVPQGGDAGKQLETSLRTLLDLSVKAERSPEEMVDWRRRIRFRPSQAARYFEGIDQDYYSKMGLNRQQQEDMFESWRETPELIFKEIQRQEKIYRERFTEPGAYSRSQAPFAAENRFYRAQAEFFEDMGDHYRPMWDAGNNMLGGLLEWFNKLDRQSRPTGGATDFGMGVDTSGATLKKTLQAGIGIGTGIAAGGGAGALIGGAIGMLGGPVGMAGGAAIGAAIGGMIAGFTELMALNPKLREQLAKTGRSIVDFTKHAWTWASETWDAIAKGGSAWELIFKPAWEAFGVWIEAEWERFKKDVSNFWHVELPALIGDAIPAFLEEVGRIEHVITDYLSSEQFKEDIYKAFRALGSVLAKGWNEALIPLAVEMAKLPDKFFEWLTSEELWDAIARGFSEMGTFIKNLMKNVIMGMWNDLWEGLGSPPTPGQEQSRQNMGDMGDASQQLPQPPLNAGELLQQRLEAAAALERLRLHYEGGGGFQAPARQHGGVVRGGMPYMVGETGREMFIPNADGSIAPMRAGISIDSHKGPGASEALNKAKIIQFNAAVGTSAMSVRNFTDALDDATTKIRELFAKPRSVASGGGGSGGGAGTGPGGAGAGAGAGGGWPSTGGWPSAPAASGGAPSGPGGGGAPSAPGGALGTGGAPAPGTTGGAVTPATAGMAPVGSSGAPDTAATVGGATFGMGGGAGAGGGAGYGPYGKPGSEYTRPTPTGGTSAAPAAGTLGGKEGFTLEAAQGTQTQAAMGVGPGEWEAYRYGLASIESRGHGSGAQRYDVVGGSSNRFSGAYQFGQAEIAETAQQLGETPPTRNQYLNDPAMQERYLDQYTKTHHDYLMKNSPEYQGMTSNQRLAVLGYAHNQGAGGAAKWLRTGVVGSDAFNTPGTAYGAAINERLAIVQGAGGAPVAAGGALGTGGAAATATGGGVVTMMNQGKTRNDPLSADTDRYLRYASMKTGLEAHVTSGGQENIPYSTEAGKKARFGAGGAAATGTHRHDEGGAGDIMLYDPVAKRYLNMDNPADAARMEEFTKQSVVAGASGVGAGMGYMGTSTVHVGGGHEASWGGADWIERARVEGMKGRLPQEQIIAQLEAGGMTKQQAIEAARSPARTNDMAKQLAQRSQEMTRARGTGTMGAPPPSGIGQAPAPSSLDAMGFGGPHTGASASATWQTQRDALGVSRYDTLKAREAAMAGGGTPSGLTTQFTGTSRRTATERGEFTHLPVRPDVPGSPGHPGNMPGPVRDGLLKQSTMMPQRDPLAHLTPLQQSVALGRGAVDVQLHLDKNLIATRPAVQQAANFDLGVNVDRTGFPHSRPGDPAFTPPLPFG